MRRRRCLPRGCGPARPQEDCDDQRQFLEPRAARPLAMDRAAPPRRDRKSTRLNSSHLVISYAVFCLKKKKKKPNESQIDNSAAPTSPDLPFIMARATNFALFLYTILRTVESPLAFTFELSQAIIAVRSETDKLDILMS